MRAMIKVCAAVGLVAMLPMTGTALAEDHGDKKAIEQAVLNYVNAIYNMQPELIDESVSPRLQKLGYMPAEDAAGLVEDWMSFDQLRELAGSLNKDGMFDPETSPKKVKVLHNTDTIANVKLDAAWGIDYIHLSKHSGKWMIMNVIWEMPSE